MEIVYIILIFTLLAVSVFLGFSYINKSNKGSDVGQRLDALNQNTSENLNNVSISALSKKATCSFDDITSCGI